MKSDVRGIGGHREELKGFRREATDQGVVPSLQRLGGRALVDQRRSQTLTGNDGGGRERPRD